MTVQEHTMERVQVGYAKPHLSALLGQVEQGEELAIAKRGKVKRALSHPAFLLPAIAD